ncbi:GvpL/GvpF family gas vesicle protein [Alkalicoccus chagannorensis]|uniref:GvpL/GvpF family gas vesicle protein n=1 Tax=Alkalicoccus chagannorensis TaxID=427072 RepID=UPI000414E86D|nr:GvpL/GvpF family gas vesicle protein [Alkalicoccus chagannorensis]
MSYYYVYGFMPTDVGIDYPEAAGIDGDDVKYAAEERITVVYTEVSPDVYGEAALQKQVEDVQWLKEKAFHHHDIVQHLYKQGQVIPLTFGTVYENYQNVEETARFYQDAMHELFEELEGTEEWSIKLFVDKDQYNTYMKNDSDLLQDRIKEIEAMPKGKQFFEKRKLKEWLENASEEELKKKAHELHEQLQQLTKKASSKKNWSRQASGRKEEMFWNGVYLLAGEEQLKEVEALVRSFQDDYEHQGIIVEATGPWPAYHFAVLPQMEKPD